MATPRQKPTPPAGSGAAATSIDRIVAASVRGASTLVLLQLFTRMLTFILNQVLLRYTSPSTLGIATVQLELIIMSILFLCREAIRCTLLRQDDDRQTNGGTPRSDDDQGALCQEKARMLKQQQAVNLSYVP